MEREADVTIRDTSLKSIIHAAVGDSKSMEYLLEVKVAIVTISDRHTLTEGLLSSLNANLSGKLHLKHCSGKCVEYVLVVVCDPLFTSLFVCWCLYIEPRSCHPYH